MTSDLLLLTIRPEHAAQIYSGQKRAELRKSFPANARIVFLYETEPVGAITGAFTVLKALQASVSQAVELAAEHGVDPDRAETYYGDRDKGWVVRIGLSVRFETAIRRDELRRRDHYFNVPQTFSYLDRFEGLTQFLMDRFVDASSKNVHLRPITEESRGAFEKLMLTEVGADYDDIDDDFVSQVLNEGVGLRAAFSTTAKHALEAHWGPHVIGYTVLTQKSFGAWKTGPSILLTEYRSLGLGQAVRHAIRKYCVEHGALSVYCTAADTKPTVVSYLLNSGMQFQARLREHLASDRDELVFAEQFKVRPAPPVITKRKLNRGARIVRLGAEGSQTQKAINFFLSMMPYWYFKPQQGLRESVLDGVRSFDEGSRRYSDKGRALFALRSSRGHYIAVALVTMKRSEMAKINLVSSVDSAKDQGRLLGTIVRQFSQLRRFYLTTPMSRLETIGAAISLGFAFEGILENPFGTGLDHACLGLVKRGKRKVRT